MESNTMDMLYKITPALFLILAGLLAFAGVAGQARTGKTAWTMITISGVMLVIERAINCLIQYRFLAIGMSDSIYLYAISVIALELLGWTFLLVGLYQLVNERKNENSFGQ
ncbi:MAG TPA: hypothetical protein VI112_00165 [Bacteroidia bacterium]